MPHGTLSGFAIHLVPQGTLSAQAHSPCHTEYTEENRLGLGNLVCLYKANLDRAGMPRANCIHIPGARSSVFSDMPEGMICVGSPAKPVKARVE